MKTILTERFGVTSERIVLTARFQEDLGLDSLDAVDLLFAVNDTFGTRIPGEALSDIHTVSQLAALIEKQNKN